MRRALDTLYSGALVASALCLVAIAILVFAQISGRILDRALLAMGLEIIGFQVPSLAEIGGFLFAAAAFLALPATLLSGTHVRVTLLAGALPPATTRLLTGLTLAAALAIAGFAAFHSALQALDSWQFNSVSFGMIRIPLWIPQGAMTTGLAIFTIALADEFLALIRGHTPAFAAAEAARAIEETH